MNKIALVAVEKALYSFDRLYSYIIPMELTDMVTLGKRVEVPFGKGGGISAGMVFELSDTCGENVGAFKCISEVNDIEPSLSQEMLNIARWMKENTFCTYYQAVKCILPPVLRVSGNTAFTEKAEKIVQIADSENIPDNLTPKQRSVVDALDSGVASIKELCYLCNVTSSVVTNLIAKGILAQSHRAADFRKPEYIISRNADDIKLNDEQQAAYDTAVKLAGDTAPKCALLHGVTGSGKTSVFIKLVAHVLKTGKTAMILVPEIALTPQMIAIFIGYFANTAAVIHSGLSVSERNKQYKAVRDGKVKIVIGTRSAVFAPLENIGLIVIDEEGEGTYKSERCPRYHVRDIAKQRCFHHSAMLLLASATPSMDSYHNAKIGKYTLLELNKRYSQNPLPAVLINDMRLERAKADSNTSENFGTALLDALRDNIRSKEQSLVLLNRRGFNTYVCCNSCGEVAQCPNCRISLTYHRNNNREILSCHYCGYMSSDGIGSCSICHGRSIRRTGSGTQRIEAELQELFPHVRILRMDADTTMTKGAYEKNFKLFGKGEYDIMVGTQMIAKGLDFPGVTLVAILGIDNTLYAGDYLGYERTFSLITQVVGRGGRGFRPGKAILQTFTPDHYVLQLAAKQDYRGFYNEEASIRKSLLFPPFCDICIVEVSDVSENTAAANAAAFVELFKTNLRGVDIPIKLLGPAKHGYGSIGGRYRQRIMLKCRNSPLFREVMSKTLAKSKGAVSAWFM